MSARTDELRPPARRYDYVADGPAIYVDSFATIRREADLSLVPADAEKLAVRMVHGSGQVDLVPDLVIHPRLVAAARAALAAGAPVLCDARMVAMGVTASRLPAGNEVLLPPHRPRGARPGPPLAHHPHRGRGVAVGAAPRGRRRGDRQRADRAVPPARDDPRRRPASGGGRSAARWASSGPGESKEALASFGDRPRHRPAVRDRPRSPRRLGDGLLGRQRAGPGGGVSTPGAGRLYGVGLGPGDPELVTLKAARLIGAADVVAYHAGVGKQSNARRIAADLIPAGVVEEELRYPVTTGTTGAPRRVRRRDGGLLRRVRRAAGRAPGGRARRGGARRGRPALLRLLHVPARPARGALRDRDRAGGAGVRGGHRRHGHAVGAPDRRAHGAARHAAEARARASAGRHRRSGDHEARPHLPRRARGARRGRAPRPRAVRRARSHARAAVAARRRRRPRDRAVLLADRGAGRLPRRLRAARSAG